MAFVTMEEDAAAAREPSKGGFVPLSEDEKPEEKVGLLERGARLVKELLAEKEAKPRGAGLMYEQASQAEKNQALARERSPAFIRHPEARPIEGPEASVGTVAADLAAAPGQGLRQIRAGIRTAAGDVTGSDYLRQKGLREAAAVGTEQAASEPQFESETAQGLYGGVRSLAQQAPGFAFGLAGRAAALRAGLAQAGLNETADEYTRYRARGASPGLAGIAALGGGATEVLTELAPMGTLVNKFGKKGAALFLGELLAKDVPGEEVATLVQDALDTAVANPEKTWGQYLEERPSAAWQTLLATFGQAGVVGGAHVGAKGLGRLVAPPEAVDVGRDAARVAKAAGKKAKIDLTQLTSTTDEETGETTFQTPSGQSITKDQWDNAGRRVREAWLQPAPEAAQPVPRETPADQRPVVNGVRVDEQLEAAPAPQVGAEGRDYGLVDEAGLPYRKFESGGVVDADTEFHDVQHDRVYPLEALEKVAAPADEAEHVEAAPPPKSERVQELERLASKADTAEARKELQKQADQEAKREENDFRKQTQADDLMRLAKQAKNETIAAELRARALKLRGAETKAETETPAKAGLRAREETVEHVEAKPIKEPTTEEVNKRAAQVAEEARPEPAGPARVVETRPEPEALTKTRSESPILKALQRFGGIKESEMADMGIEKKTGAKRKEQFITKKGKRVTREVSVRDDFRVGKDSLFRKDGKLGMDDAAEWLQQHGYLADQADHERAREIIRKELAEPGSMKKIAAAEEDMLSAAEKRRTEEADEATLTEARSIGIETEGRPVAEVERALRDALDNDWTKTYGLPLDSIESASIARRASDIDEQATHDAAVRHGDDEAGFIREAQEIINANEKRNTAGRRENAEPAADQASRRAAASEGKPQAAAALAGREAAVRSEQRVRPAEPDQRLEAEPKPAGTGRAAPTGGVEPKVARTLRQTAQSMRERFKRTDYDIEPAAAPTEPQHRLAIAVAKTIFDTSVHWFTQRGPLLTAGFRTQRHPGAIFLETKASYPAMAVTGHELLHELRAQQPEVYNDLAKALLPILKNVDAHRRALGSLYERKGGELPSVDKAFEELIADVVGDRFTEPEFWQEVAKANPGRFEKIAQAVIKFIDEVIAKVTKARPFESEKYLTDLNKARTAVAQALDKYHGSIAEERDLTASVQRAQADLSIERGRVTSEDLEAAGADAKKMAEHKQAVDAKIKDFLGEKAFNWMEQHGLLRPTWSWDDTSPLARDPNVPAYTGVREGQARVVLYYDRITDPEHVPALLMHEIGTHFGMKRMLGEEGFKTTLEQIRALHERREPVFTEAWQRVKRDYIDEPTKPFFAEGSDAFLEEVAAAVVESHPQDSFVKRLISQVRAWVHQNISPKLAGKMDENLLKGLALAALRKSGRGELSTEATPPASADQAATDVMMARPGRTPPPKSVATTHASVVERAVDYFNRNILDSFSQLKKRQLAWTRGALSDALNTYAREQLMHSRATERLKDIGTDYLSPIIKIAGEAELTREDMSDGLYAMHAKEANDYIATINPAMPDGGSGLTNKIAADILKSYTPAQRKALDKIDAVVQKMNNAKLDRMVSEGLITPQQRADMQKRYKHWLSMKQMDDEAVFGFSGGGLSVKGKEFQARKGRFSQAEDPLSMTVRDAMYGIMRAEKNRVAVTFYNFVKANPNPKVWEEITPANYPPNSLDLWRDPEYFGAKINGEQKWIRVKDSLLAEQMHKLGDHGLDSNNELWRSVIRGVNTATRILSRFYTQFSFDFAFVNPLRDVQQGALVASSFDKKKGGQLMRRMLVNLPSALKDAAVANFQEMMGKRPTGALYNQFRLDGGTTGGFGLDDARTIQKEMERALAAINGDKKAKAAMFAQALVKPVMALNDSFENMTRFATYKAALESGFTREQAAVMAKNVTVNFNKRGMASPGFNAMYAFFNASMQANAAAVRAVMRSRIAQTASLALFAAGAYAAFGDDEDERGVDESERVSEFVLDRNVTIPYGDKKTIKIPLAYGFNIPYAAGRHLVRVVQGKESAAHMLGAILKLGFTTFLPTDTIVPTVGQPIADVVTGKDFANRQIAKENPFDAVTPKSSQYKDNANAAAVAFFKALNRLGGGTEYTKGVEWMDVSPEKATYLVKQYLGGLAMPLEVAALPWAEKTTMADIPVARRFVAEAKEDLYITKAARIIREADARRKAIESGADEAKPGEEEYVQTVRAYESALRRLSAARNRMLKEDKKADVSEVDEQRNLLADQVLTARRAFQREEAR